MMNILTNELNYRVYLNPLFTSVNNNSKENLNSVIPSRNSKNNNHLTFKKIVSETFIKDNSYTDLSMVYGFLF